MPESSVTINGIRTEQAFEAFAAAVKLNPNDAYTQRNLGGMLVAMKRPAEGIPYLRKALALMPDDAHSIYGLALALSDLKKEVGKFL